MIKYRESITVVSGKEDVKISTKIKHMYVVGIYPIKLLIHSPTPEERRVDRNYDVTSSSSSEVTESS